MKDYYKILGVDSTATAAEIKKKYKMLAGVWHPDKWVNSSESDRCAAEGEFKDIEEAYRVLKDPINRAHFDQTGSGKMPKSKDMAVKKVINLFQKYIKEALEAELEYDLKNELMAKLGLKETAPTGMDSVIENVRLELTNDRDSADFSIDALTKGIAKLNKYKRKVITMGGVSNLYLQVIEQQLDATRGALANAGIDKIALETALDSLSYYSYTDFEPEDEMLAIPGHLRNQDNLAAENELPCDCEGSHPLQPEERCDECPRWGHK